MKKGRFWAMTTTDGLRIPLAALAQGNIEAGDLMQIELLPRSERHSVGELLDGGEFEHGVRVVIGAPAWKDGTWSATVLNAETGELLGYATRAARGEMAQFASYPPKEDLIAPLPCSIQESFDKGVVEMNELIIEPSASGIHINGEQLEAAGIDAKRRLALVTLPDAETIVHRALRFVIRKLGDAIGVCEPVWENDEWTVELLAPDRSTNSEN